MSGARGELRSLTALRGVAALAVVAQHFSATAQGLTRTTIPSLVPHGYMAVDFFFVLSGFIMCYTYADAFLARRPRAYRDFLGRRVARVIPLHVCVILLILLAGALSQAIAGIDIFLPPALTPSDVAAHLTLLSGLGLGAAINGPSWSISTELVAYLLFPVLMLGVFHRRAPIAAVSAAAACGVVVALAAQLPRFGLAYDAPPGSVLRCVSEFTLGMCAYRTYQHPPLRAFLAGNLATTALALASVAALLLRIDLLAALLFPPLVVAFAANTGTPARWMGSRVPYFLGVVSYSIYLIHNPLRAVVLLAAQTLLPSDAGPVVALLVAAVGTVAVIPFAWVAYRWIEVPGRDLVRRVL